MASFKYFTLTKKLFSHEPLYTLEYVNFKLILKGIYLNYMRATIFHRTFYCSLNMSFDLSLKSIKYWSSEVWSTGRNRTSSKYGSVRPCFCHSIEERLEIKMQRKRERERDREKERFSILWHLFLWLFVASLCTENIKRDKFVSSHTSFYERLRLFVEKLTIILFEKIGSFKTLITMK